jgi:glycerol-3-phosphate dehydrogenase
MNDILVYAENKVSKYMESNLNRSNFSKQRYDFVVIGGGISGAAVAYDAALRGFSVALIEREDFGSKTSAAT